MTSQHEERPIACRFNVVHLFLMEGGGMWRITIHRRIIFSNDLISTVDQTSYNGKDSIDGNTLETFDRDPTVTV